ncbi:hypothetical protein [Streptomyces sp. RFCAC02]|uniref:hypothetical protein n=1 Tax=Streptomyces sp. RFCAC02 TaxID=2499143 RepID=UPI0010215967|nr:hypothetical protein [Streptomyces sp. RFCAC02]
MGAILFLVLGCRQHHEDSAPGASNGDLSEMCDGELEAMAVQRIEKIADRRDDILSSTHETLSDIADSITVEYLTGGATTGRVRTHRMCEVSVDRAAPQPDLTLDFQLLTLRQLDNAQTPADSDVFALGRRALATSRRASVHFDCVIPSSGRSSPATVRAHLSVRAGSTFHGGTSQDTVAVAHSVALSLARAMRCEDDGGLEDEPDLRPVR